MKKEVLHAKLDRIIRKTVTHMVDTELYVWPPACAVFLYQPVRPKVLNVEAGDKQSEMDKR